MNVSLRMTAALAEQVRRDLRRRHPFAAERVGFLLCRAGALPEGGILIVAAGYQAVEDADYVNDRSVGAMMGPGAIRKGMQSAYNGGAQDISLFHVHEHAHFGLPGYSRTDWREMHKFVPDFFNAAPAMPHGALVLSHDLAVVAGVVSRVIVLRQGVAVEAGPVGEVFSRPRDAYTSSLVAAARAFDAALGGQP